MGMAGRRLRVEGERPNQRLLFNPEPGIDFEPIDIPIPQVIVAKSDEKDFTNRVTKEIQDKCGHVACTGAGQLYMPRINGSIEHQVEAGLIRCAADGCPLDERPGTEEAYLSVIQFEQPE